MLKEDEYINKLIVGDALRTLKKLPDSMMNMCVTSPPYYGLRDYGLKGQIGLEDSPEKYIYSLVRVFREVKRVLKDDGTLWVNIGDSYNGSGKAKNDKSIDRYKQKTNKYSRIGKTSIRTLKEKDLIGIPWMLAFALRKDGWYLRQDIIWSKPNPMPESVKDRCTKAHEYIFLLSKQKKYYFDYEAIMEEAAYDGRKDMRMKGSHKYAQEGVTGLQKQDFSAREHERWIVKDGRFMRNKRDVWEVNTKPFTGAHFAVFPEDLIVDCIKAGCPEGGFVLDPFFGSGTTGVVARKLNRNFTGIDLGFKEISDKRMRDEMGLFLEVCSL